MVASAVRGGSEIGRVMNKKFDDPCMLTEDARAVDGAGFGKHGRRRGTVSESGHRPSRGDSSGSSAEHGATGQHRLARGHDHGRRDARARGQRRRGEGKGGGREVEHFLSNLSFGGTLELTGGARSASRQV